MSETMLGGEITHGTEAQGFVVLLLIPFLSLVPSIGIDALKRGYITIKGMATYRDRRPGEFWLVLAILFILGLFAALFLLILGITSPNDLPTSLSFDLVFLGAIGLALRKPQEKRERWDRAPSITFIALSLPAVIANAANLFPTKPDALASLLLVWFGVFAIGLHATVAARGRPIRKFRKALPR